MSFINSKQTPEQRRVKYNFIHDCGFSTEEARKMRDWTHGHIVRYLNVNVDKIRTSYESIISEEN